MRSPDLLAATGGLTSKGRERMGWRDWTGLLMMGGREGEGAYS